MTFYPPVAQTINVNPKSLNNCTFAVVLIFGFIFIFATLGLHLGFSAVLKIWQVPAVLCRWDHPPNHRISWNLEA